MTGYFEGIGEVGLGAIGAGAGGYLGAGVGGALGGAAGAAGGTVVAPGVGTIGLGAVGGAAGAAAGGTLGAAGGGALGWYAGGGLGRGLDWALGTGDSKATDKANEAKGLSGGDKSNCGGQCAKSESSDGHTKSDKKPPFTGEPGSTTQGPDNSRTYGDDGYPLTDRDTGHPDESGIGNGDHSHDWSRPEGGGPPTNVDRGPPRLPQPSDPPAPWRGS